jgi:hypothetical protein
MLLDRRPVIDINALIYVTSIELGRITGNNDWPGRAAL